MIVGRFKKDFEILKKIQCKRDPKRTGKQTRIMSFQMKD